MILGKYKHAGFLLDFRRKQIKISKLNIRISDY
jgi:hypothetical protein